MAIDQGEEAVRFSAIQLRKTSWEVAVQCAALPAAATNPFRLGETHGFGEAGAVRGEHRGPEIIGLLVAIHWEWRRTRRRRRPMQIADP